MPRVCFTLQVDPARLDEYRAWHAEVWPEMLAALRDAGWRDYTLHLRDDGLLVGVLVTGDFGAAQAAMERTDVNRRWQAEMARFFPELTDGRPDRGMHVLDEVFNLEAQLARPAPTEEGRAESARTSSRSSGAGRAHGSRDLAGPS